MVVGNFSTPATVKPTEGLATTLHEQEPDYYCNWAGIGGASSVRSSGVFDITSTHTTKPCESGLFSALLKTSLNLAIRPWRFSCFLGHVHKVGNRAL